MTGFRPSLAATLGLLTLAAACVMLAGWQQRRAGEKAARMQAWAEAPAWQGLPQAGEAPEFLHVTLTGRFDAQRHLLADNQVLDAHSGVHVYTPFAASDGTTVLVNRGWLPLPASRTPLPAVPTPDLEMTISGRLGDMPKSGRQLGQPTPLDAQEWPQLVTYPSIGRMADTMPTKLYPRVLFLDPGSPGGFSGRNWKPVYMTPAKHRAYAFQWTALAVLSVACWVVTGIRRARGIDHAEP